MGYYTDLRNQILEVEKQGFNPYMETYERRVGQLSPAPDSNVPPPQETVSETPINYSEAYTARGYEDPFANLATEEGKLNEPAFTAGYNLLQTDPSIGITQDDYLNYTNKNFPQVLQNTYGTENYNVTRSPTGGIMFPRENELVNRRFEKSRGNKGDVFLMFDEDTGKKVTSYKDEKEYKDAIAKDLESKGLTGTTSENVYDISRIYRESKNKEELAKSLMEAGIEGVSVDEALTFNNKKGKNK